MRDLRLDKNGVVAEAGADLRDADLRDADLRNTDLCGADLRGADLCGADLRGADLRDADLRNTNLCGADLCGADLRGADLRGADLRIADLRDADLRGANLRDADLRDADLRGADLRVADLQGADTQGADLRNTNLCGANLDDLSAARLLTPPESGAFVAWKKCRHGVLVKLCVPAESRRSSATTRKCRAEFVEVLEVVGGDAGVSLHDGVTQYRVGEIVHCDTWCEDRWVECAGGIHFYMSRVEAENHV